MQCVGTFTCNALFYATEGVPGLTRVMCLSVNVRKSSPVLELPNWSSIQFSLRTNLNHAYRKAALRMNSVLFHTLSHMNEEIHTK